MPATATPASQMLYAWADAQGLLLVVLWRRRPLLAAGVAQ